MRYQGTLLKEGYGDEVVLMALTLAKARHQRVKDASKELKKRWTVISFEADSADGTDVAAAFTRYLKKSDWFLRLVNDDATLVIFAQKVFKYPKGDAQGRMKAIEYARSLKIPELLLGWKE